VLQIVRYQYNVLVPFLNFSGTTVAYELPDTRTSRHSAREAVPHSAG
jgi:hypothetical protein